MAAPFASEQQRGCIAAYWGLAIGDALGATVEFMTAREIQHQYGVHDKLIGGGWLGLPAGQITDDTAMSLALGQSILKAGGVDAHAAADAFDQWLRGKPVDVGQTVRRGIVHYRKSGSPESPASDSAAGNGACMRTLPIALVTLGGDRREIEQASASQAHITHNNALSDAACVCVIDIIHGALYGADKRELISGPITDLVQRFPEFGYRKRRMENPTGYIVDTLIAVLQAFIDTDNFKACLVDVVNRGGDADTTGAIAGMIAGAYYGLHEIPREWLGALDGRIRDACRDQALALMEMPGPVTDEFHESTALIQEMSR